MSGSPPNLSGAQNMPTPGRQNSFSSPMRQNAIPVHPSPFNQHAVPSPYVCANEMTIFTSSNGSQFSGSPALSMTSPIHSPYPEFRPIQRPSSTTSGAEFIERLDDPPPPDENAGVDEFIAWKREMLRRRELRAQALQNHQMQQQQMQNTGFVSYSGSAGPMLPRHPGHMQPSFQNGGFYGFQFENLGHAHGLPGQRSQNMVQPRGGHCYGAVNIKGDARVIRGNVVDSARPMMKSKDHQYLGELNIEGRASLWDGDHTVESANTFWGTHAQNQIN